MPFMPNCVNQVRMAFIMTAEKQVGFEDFHVVSPEQLARLFNRLFWAEEFASTVRKRNRCTEEQRPTFEHYSSKIDQRRAKYAQQKDCWNRHLFQTANALFNQTPNEESQNSSEIPRKQAANECTEVQRNISHEDPQRLSSPAPNGVGVQRSVR